MRPLSVFRSTAFPWHEDLLQQPLTCSSGGNVVHLGPEQCLLELSTARLTVPVTITLPHLTWLPFTWVGGGHGHAYR
jgi:hypothetical protein